MRVIMIECDDAAVAQVVQAVLGQESAAAPNGKVVMEVGLQLPAPVDDDAAAEKHWLRKRAARAPVRLRPLSAEQPAAGADGESGEPKRVTRADVIREILARGPHTQAALEAELGKTPQAAPWPQVYAIMAYLAKRGEIIQDEERGVWRLARKGA